MKLIHIKLIVLVRCFGVMVYKSFFELLTEKKTEVSVFWFSCNIASEKSTELHVVISQHSS